MIIPFKRIIEKEYPVLGVFVFYLFIVGLFFLQLPIQGSLPGNWDTWLYLYLFNYYPDYFAALISESPIYQPFFPESFAPFAFGEPSFFNGLIYYPIQSIIVSPIVSFYLFISLLFSLNGIGMFLLVKKISGQDFTALIAGLLLMFSNYMISSLDQPNVLSIYPSLFAIYFLIQFHQSQKWRYLLYTVVLASIQIYCSGYHFLFLSIVIGVLFVLKWNYYARKAQFYKILLGCFLLMILIYPFANLYLFSGLDEVTFNSVNQQILSDLSLHFKDLFQSHPYNIVYGNKSDEDLLYFIHSVNPGLVFILLSIGGFIQSKHKLEMALLLIFFLMISTGPDWGIVQNPVYILMNVVGLDELMRTPIRACMVLLVIGCVLSAQYLKTLGRKSMILSCILFMLYFVENVPYKLQYYSSYDYIQPPAELLKVTDDMNENEVLWIKPSTIYDSNDYGTASIGHVNREYIYMYWQTKFKKNMVNGMNGYMPKVNYDLRMKHDRIDNITVVDNVYSFKNVYLNGLEYDGEI